MSSPSSETSAKSEIKHDSHGYHDIDDFFGGDADENRSPPPKRKPSSKEKKTKTPDGILKSRANHNDTGSLSVATNNDDLDVKGYGEQDDDEITFGTKVSKSALVTEDGASSAKPRHTATPSQQRSAYLKQSRKKSGFKISQETQLDQRRSMRQKYSPLAFWKNEKVIYARRQSTQFPVIVDVVKRPDEAISSSKPRSRSHRKQKPRSSALESSGYSPKVRAVCTVFNYDTKLEEEKELALSSHHVQARLSDGRAFDLQTLFGEAGIMSSGVIHFAPQGSKPNKNSGKHALAFYVISGVFEVVIHKSSFVVGAGSHFFVPRGNQYEIRNASTTSEGCLFFCHCKIATPAAQK